MPEKRIRSNLHGPTFLPLLPCASFPIAASRPGLWSSPALLQAAAHLLCRTPWPSSKAPSDLPDQIDDDDKRICPPRRGRKHGGGGGGPSGRRRSPPAPPGG
ncbi:hypothetical protein VPH35_013383 [Triticum aestivum]